MATPIAAIIAAPVGKPASPSEAAPAKEKPEAKAAEGKAEYPEFTAPDGFNPPEGTKPGEEFDALGTFKLQDDGSVCLVAVDGVKLKPEAEKESPSEEAKEADSEGSGSEASFKDMMAKKMSEMDMPK